MENGFVMPREERRPYFACPACGIVGEPDSVQPQPRKIRLFNRTTSVRERLSRMTSEADEPRRDLFLRDGQEAADVVRVHREALRALRDSIETAHVDAYSDIAWPREVAPAYEQVLSMAANEVADGVRSAKGDPGMGIDVDVRDDMQFDALLALAPYTIHAEAWRQGREIFSASDSGTASPVDRCHSRAGVSAHVTARCARRPANGVHDSTSPAAKSVRPIAGGGFVEPCGDKPGTV
ncbi:hypothetical protein [Streptomyces sp. NPDC088183]|uniref:hypothetical protein n=1 Tax=unclassified Streptomyces TaxID=2593676 RepID=UPI00341A1AD0